MPRPYDTPMRSVLVKAEEKARTLFRKPEIGTECLFLALMEQDAQLNQVLARAGLDIATVTSRAQALLGGDHPYDHCARRPFGGATDIVLRSAQRLADQKGDDYVTTTHVMVALLNYECGVFKNILDQLHVDVEEVVRRLGALPLNEGAVTQAEMDELMDEIGDHLELAS